MSTSGRNGALAGLAVDVVGWSNRGGLRRDAEIVEQILRAAGADVTASSWYLPGSRVARKLQTITRRRWRRRFDLSIYLERAPRRMLRQARSSWLIPNPEWLEPEQGVLPQIDLILAKSRQA